MRGDVWQWLADHWHPDLSATPTDGTPLTKHGNLQARVIRGGPLYSRPKDIRGAFRGDPSKDYPDVGFRVARTAF